MQETFNIENLKGRCRENLPLSSRDQIELMWSLREPYRWLHGIREVDGQITFGRTNVICISDISDFGKDARTLFILLRDGSVWLLSGIASRCCRLNIHRPFNAKIRFYLWRLGERIACFLQ